MKTDAITPAALSKSVLAVPPLARNADFSINRAANVALIRHIEAGGVTTLLYGGNANFYNIGLYEYGGVLEMLAEAAAPGTWVIPSAGPDYGKMMDQAAVLRKLPFPTAMVLPITFPSTTAGAETALRRFAESYGKPIVVYIKAEGFVTPEGVQRLFNDGLVAAVKYAIVRPDQSTDPFLSKLVDLVDPSYIVSGIGERPAITHMKEFGVAGFTSGSVCVAPRGSAQLLEAIKRKDWVTAERLRAAYIPLEDCRDRLSPIRVLHQAVTLSGIADMGPLLPCLSNLEPEHHGSVQKAACDLLGGDRPATSA